MSEYLVVEIQHVRPAFAFVFLRTLSTFDEIVRLMYRRVNITEIFTSYGKMIHIYEKKNQECVVEWQFTKHEVAQTLRVFKLINHASTTTDKRPCIKV